MAPHPQPAPQPSPIEKQKYISEHTLFFTYYWINVIALTGAVLFPVFTIVDYFVSPKDITFFFLIRCVMVVILLLLSFINIAANRKKIKKRLLDFLVLAAAISSAAAIEIMILRLGGPGSAYYAGLILVVIGTLVIPLDFIYSIITVGMIYLVYVLPILLIKGGIGDYSAFIRNNTFLVSAMGIALIWRFLSQKNLENMLGLQYELNQSKKQLETYSTRLEHLVEERTRELKKSDLMFHSLFQNAQDGILIMDQKGNILDVNKVLCDIHGFDQNTLAGANMVLLETEENEPLFRERMEKILNGEALLYETRHYRKDGSKISLEVSSKVIEIDGRKLIQSFYRDVTEKKKMQAQLVHSQKMDSIGQLAGGIAHDFNNILTSILGFTELILLKEDVDEDIAGKVRIIDKVSRQAAQMVSKLLSFARRGYFEAVLFSADKAASDTLEMISRLIPENIVFLKQFQAPLAVVKGDINMMDQVLMNLVINAKDAMLQGGTLTVATSITTLGEGDLDIGADIEPGEYINILVRDTGTGIPEADIPHIFEPFFTTKEKGKGTGLGLAMVYGIVKEHRGYITVKSTGQGSDFNVYLPLYSKKQRGEIKKVRAVVRASAGATLHAAVGETILAIDDEAPVLEFIKETLSARGFKVITAGNPLDGLDLYRDKRGDIGLVITDMVMPAMDGGQLANCIRTINPHARIIAITGYNENNEDKNIDALIKKPFTSGRLVQAVTEILEKPRV